MENYIYKNIFLIFNILFLTIKLFIIKPINIFQYYKNIYYRNWNILNIIILLIYFYNKY